MQTNVEIWTIKELYDSLNTILEQPKYQRGAVWKPIKKQMLIDSILRGIDIPKIYLRKITHGLYEYEVADGQQRITAIKDFINKKIVLSNKTINGLDLSKINRFDVSNKNIEDINKILKKSFLKYKLTIAIVDDASNSEIRTLFGRLQMGDSLNPAEKRNALISNIGSEIDNIVLNHNFFTNCKIPAERFKRQDYLTHVLALIYYKNKYDLKSKLFNSLYSDCRDSIPVNIISNTVKVLDWMSQIDKVSQKKIVNKWSFVDVFRFLYENQSKIGSLDYQGFANTFVTFEKNRIANSGEPEKLIMGKHISKKNNDLYKYIVDFKSNGGSPKLLDRRFLVFTHLFSKYIQ